MTYKHPIELTPLGGAETIGASCYLVRVHDTVALIDFGAAVGTSAQQTFDELLRGFEAKVAADRLGDLSAFFLSHAHTDHCGLVPAFYRYLRQRLGAKHPPYFYASQPTQLLMPFTCRNVADYDTSAPFSDNDIDAVFHYIKSPIGHGSPEEIDWLRPELGTWRFYQTSHLLGSAMVELTVQGKTVLYTGDLRLDESPTLPSAAAVDKQPDLLIVDGTYAGADARRLASWSNARLMLHDALDRVLGDKGTVLLPCFALGRTQDILALVLEHATASPIPYYIFIDGQARQVTQEIYPRFGHLLNPSFVKMLKENTWRIRWVDPSHPLEALAKSEVHDYPAVVIASSGMLAPGSASYRWAAVLASQPNVQIVTTGYLTEDIHEELFDKQTVASLRLEHTPIKLPISGHSSQEATADLVDRLSPRVVAIVHCGGGDLHGPGSLEHELRQRGFRAFALRRRSTLELSENGVFVDGIKHSR